MFEMGYAPDYTDVMPSSIPFLIAGTNVFANLQLIIRRNGDVKHDDRDEDGDDDT